MTGCTLQEDRHAALAESSTRGSNFRDNAADSMHLLVIQFRNGSFVGEIEIVTRKVKEQVACRANTYAGKKFGPCPTHFGHLFDRRIEQRFRIDSHIGILEERELRIETRRLRSHTGTSQELLIGSNRQFVDAVVLGVATVACHASVKNVVHL